jgi:hypothetical protein
VKALAVLVVLTAIANAEPNEYLQRAHAAAAHGDCARVIEIGTLVRELDAAYYRATFVGDREVAACIAAAPSDRVAPTPPLPPLSPTRVAAEVVVGGALAAPVSLLGALVGYEALGGGLLGAYGAGGGLLVAWSLAAPIGVYVVGSSGDETGSYLAAQAGAIVGGAGGIGAMYATHGNGVGIAIALVAPVVGATVGFNLTRKLAPATEVALHPHLDVTRDHAIAGLGGTF